MPTERKVQAVEELTNKLREATMVVLTDYRGLKVADLANLRQQLRAAQVEFNVTKNTMLTLAAEQVGMSNLTEGLAGPTAVAFCHEDIAAAARVLSDFARASRVLAVRKALVERQILEPEDVSRLGTLPPRERLRAEVVGSVAGPLSGFVGVLNSVLAMIIGVLDARVEQLQSAAPAA